MVVAHLSSERKRAANIREWTVQMIETTINDTIKKEIDQTANDRNSNDRNIK
jgi:hypothetical protein